MRKLLLTSAAVAIFALGSVNTAKAQEAAGTGLSGPNFYAGAAMYAGFGLFMIKLVADDIASGGLKRGQRAYVPGEGYTASLDTRLKNNPALAEHIKAYEVAYKLDTGSVMVASAAQ